jgi:hypothetical protein
MQVHHHNVALGRPRSQKKLTCRYAGRGFRLTDVSGEVVKDILA